MQRCQYCQRWHQKLLSAAKIAISSLTRSGLVQGFNTQLTELTWHVPVGDF